MFISHALHPPLKTMRIPKGIIGHFQNVTMPATAQHLPVSRDLVRIIRECSRLEQGNHTLTEHIRCIEDRQAKAVEFYLRACALRLDQGM